MPVRRTLLGIAALAAFGCNKQPEAVFVDLESIVRGESSQFQPPEFTSPSEVAAIPPKSYSIKGLPTKAIADNAGKKIEVAKKLIDQERESAIRVLTRRLGTIKNAEIDGLREKALDDLGRSQAEYMASVFDQLYALFSEYAEKKGPTTFRIEFLKVKKPDLYVSRTSPTGFAEKQARELADLKALAKKMEGEYEAKAIALLSDASARLNSERISVLQRFETRRANELEAVEAEARRTIGKATSGQGLDIGANRNVLVPANPAHSITVSGSEALLAAPIVPSVSVRSLAERTRSAEEQLEIWLKSQGLVRSVTRSDGRDATDEFASWRKTHQVGH